MLVPATSPPPDVQERTMFGVMSFWMKYSHASKPKLPWPAIISSLSNGFTNGYCFSSAIFNAISSRLSICLLYSTTSAPLANVLSILF